MLLILKFPIVVLLILKFPVVALLIPKFPVVVLLVLKFGLGPLVPSLCVAIVCASVSGQRLWTLLASQETPE